MRAAINLVPMRDMRAALLLWWPVMLGLGVLLLPTYLRLNHDVWNDEAQAHGPFVLLVVIWLFVKKWRALMAIEGPSWPVSGIAFFSVGLLLYIIGRSQSLILLEVGAQIPILIGLLLFLFGWRAVKLLWFPLLFLIFMVPLPGFVIDGITGPLKGYVSAVVDWVLYGVGYPISRNGVIISIGPYQLLVADACSGLNSMFSLSAMGLLYLHLMQYRSKMRNILMIASILPIAFLANVIRVMLLVLVTYYFGDATGQAFHEYAGILLFLLALLLLFSFDALLKWVFKKSESTQP